MKTQCLQMVILMSIFYLFHSLGLAETNKLCVEIKPEWRIVTYPVIGLNIKIPTEKLDIMDTTNEWSLLADPSVSFPNSDVQYNLKISIYKYTKDQYERQFKDKNKSAVLGMGSEHLKMWTMTNAQWIYIRKDIHSSNEPSFSCVGRIKRGSDSNAVQSLLRNATCIIESVSVTLSNPASLIHREPLEEQKSSSKLFNALTLVEVEDVKKRLDFLKVGMNQEECSKVLNIGHHDMPTSVWGPADKQCVSFMLTEGHILLLVWNAQVTPATLISARLDEKQWP